MIKDSTVPKGLTLYTLSSQTVKMTIKSSKISKKILLLFSIKLMVLRAGIFNMPVKTGNGEESD